MLEGADFAGIEQALLLLAAEMSGGLSGVLHVIIDYLTTRKQFDQYIGSYQSLKHPTVQILLSMEACRSHLYRAATCIAQNNTEEIEGALRMAKAQGSDAFAFLPATARGAVSRRLWIHLRMRCPAVPAPGPVVSVSVR